jgi:predicted GTPase
MRTGKDRPRHQGGPGRVTLPRTWLACVQEFARLAEYHAIAEDTRRWRDEITATITTQRQRLQVPPKVVAPPSIPAELKRAVDDTLRYLRCESGRLLEDLQATVEDFEHAAENEDRFVVLVFGRVKAGKSALANHMAGLEFGLPPESCAECFVEHEQVSRLEEAPIECTRDYQGFRSKGLLWIDCPGVGSTTFANGELARRLVARADFVLFVTSSDAPLCASELRELHRLIRDSGNEELEGLFVITKSDKYVLDEDPETEEIIRRIVPKSVEEQREQSRWVREQIEEGGIGQQLQGREPLAVSVYVARDRLGLSWLTGIPHGPLAADWQTAYEASGINELCHYLAHLVSKNGVRLKKLWPHKRLNAIQRKLQEASDQAGKRVRDLRLAIRSQRQLLQQAERTAADDAAQFAAGKVGRCLKSWCIDDLGRFNRAAASRELQSLLRSAVQRAVRDTVQPILGRAFQEMDAALCQFAANSQFDLELRQKTRQKTYTSTQKAAAGGRAAGGLGGALAAGSVGMIFGPIGGIIGSILGGLLGSLAGEQIGPMVWEEKRTVEVPAGTNADEVIRQTEQAIRRQGEEAIADIFRRLDETIFAPLDEELGRLESEVREWPLALKGGRDTLARSRRRVLADRPRSCAAGEVGL